MTDMDFSSTRFREAMAHLPAPVAVITASAGTHPHGTTVSAVTSLSLMPPMVLVSLDRRSDLLSIVESTHLFGVNVLSSDQAHLALRFVTKGADKFDGVPWQLDHGVPRLPGAVVWLCCAVSGLVDGGDHVIVLGEVNQVDHMPTVPLTYHARTFGIHSPIET